MPRQRDLRDEVGPSVKQLTVPSANAVQDIKSVHPTGIRSVSSYDWLDAQLPTIAVPGSPPKWSPNPPLPTRVRQDAGLVYIDQNASRNADYPLEPLFRAVFAHDASFDPKTLDVVTDRNNLRKLLRVISQDSFEPFRIDIELVGNTLLLTRWESDTEEYITEFRGFGHEFEKAFTTPKTVARGQTSSGHHRIIQYKFGGLQMLVRFETDAHYAHLAGTPTTTTDDIDSLTSAIKSVRLESEEPTPLLTEKSVTSPARSSDIKVILEGGDVSHDSLIEIKTRVKHRRIVMNDVAPQLFFAQVPYLIVAYHVRGVFQTVETKDVVANGTLEDFERNNVTELKKVINMLDTIRKEIRKVRGRRGVLLCEMGSFTLYERSIVAKHALPSDLLAKWA